MMGDTEQDRLRGQICEPAAIRRFLEAGNATLTLVSRGSGQRFTFRFRRAPEENSRGERPYFVSLLSGPDNTRHYTYMGALLPNRLEDLRITRASRISTDAPSFRAASWMLGHLYGGTGHALLRQAEVWHEGRCGRCGRKLTVPESVATGFGPDCAAQVGI